MFSFFGEDESKYVPAGAGKHSQMQEPDWAPHQNNGRQPYDTRDHYGSNGRNFMDREERDTRMPMSNFQNPQRAGLRIPASPRQIQNHRSKFSPFQSGTNGFESYASVIDEVNDSLRGNTAINSSMKGLWKVYDAAMSELGSELQDSLSNKAIFEACVKQENSFHKGKRMTDLEKKENAANRKNQYETALRTTLMRLRGSFADVLLAAKQDIQSSFERQAAEMQKSFDRQAADMQSSFDRKAAEMERGRSVEYEGVKDLEIQRKNLEIQRLTNELNSAQLIAGRARGEMAGNRENVMQAVTNAERARDNAVAKLSSTLETLQNTCLTVERTEQRLRQTEERLNQTEAKLRTETEKTNLLQAKLDSESRNKVALTSVQQEMEEQLKLERERADLMQQKIGSAERSKQELVRLQQTDKYLRDELGRLTSSLDKSTRENEGMRAHLKKVSDVNASLNNQVNVLQTQVDSQGAAYSQLHSCKEQLKKVTDENTELKENLSTMQSQLNKQGAALNAAMLENSQIDSYKAQLKTSSEELASCRNQLNNAGRLQSQYEEQTTSLNTQLLSCRDELRKVTEESKEHLRRAIAEKSAREEQLRRAAEQISSLNNTAQKQAMEISSYEDHLKRAAAEKNAREENMRRAAEEISSLNTAIEKLQSQAEKQVKQLHSSKMENSQILSRYGELSSALTSCKEQLQQASEENVTLKSNVHRLQSRVDDQVLELQAARMSEAEVERSLEESLKRIKELDAKLTKYDRELQEANNKWRDECKQRMQKEKELKEAVELINKLENTTSSELEHLQKEIENKNCELEGIQSHSDKAIKELEKKIGELESDLNARDSEAKQLEILNKGLKTERDSLKMKLDKCQEDFSNDREKIVNALAGFDEEMTSAETKVRSVLEELDASQKTVKDLTESKEKVLEELASEKKKLKEATEILCKMEEEIGLLKAEVKKNQLEHNDELEVYQEAIKMLQEQIDSVTEDAAEKKQEHESEAIEKLKKHHASLLTTQKMHHESVIRKKDIEIIQLREDYRDREETINSLIKKKDRRIIELREECQDREMTVSRLEALCKDAQSGLLSLRERNKYLEGSLKKSKEFIQDLKSLRTKVEDYKECHRKKEGNDGKKQDVVAGMMADLDRVFKSVAVATPVKLTSDNQFVEMELGSEMEAFFTYIDDNFGGCSVADEDKSYYSQKSNFTKIIPNTKSW